MIAFQLKRSSRDLVGHTVLILFPLALIFFFDYLYKNVNIETGGHFLPCYGHHLLRRW